MAGRAEKGSAGADLSPGARASGPDSQTRWQRRASTRHPDDSGPGGEDRGKGIGNRSAEFDASAYWSCPRRSAQDAVQAVHRALCDGFTEVVDADCRNISTPSRTWSCCSVSLDGWSMARCCTH